MVKHCCIKGCKSEAYGGCGKSFFRLPNNQLQRQKWLDVVPTSGKNDSVVCSDHFKPGDINVHIGTAKLKPNAVPSVNLVMPENHVGNIIVKSGCSALQLEPSTKNVMNIVKISVHPIHKIVKNHVLSKGFLKNTIEKETHKVTNQKPLRQVQDTPICTPLVPPGHRITVNGSKEVNLIKPVYHLHVTPPNKSNIHSIDESSVTIQNSKKIEYLEPSTEEQFELDLESYGGIIIGTNTIDIVENLSHEDPVKLSYHLEEIPLTVSNIPTPEQEL